LDIKKKRRYIDAMDAKDVNLHHHQYHLLVSGSQRGRGKGDCVFYKA
jgi:hypothetical protein